MEFIHIPFSSCVGAIENNFRFDPLLLFFPLLLLLLMFSGRELVEKAESRRSLIRMIT
jgi:hypothetical protein